MITVKRIETINQVEQLRDTWMLLIDNFIPNSIELTFEWQISYWKHLSGNASLFILIAIKNGEIIAIAPLKIHVESILGIHFRTLEPIGASESNYQNLVVGEQSQEIIEAFLNYIYEHNSCWDVFRLPKIPGDSLTIHHINEYTDKYHFPHSSFNDQCAYLEIGPSWQNYQNSLDSKRKHRVNNRIRKAARELGNLKLNCCAYPSEYIGEVEQFFNLHRKRWNPTDTPSQFNQIEQCEFYKEAGARLMGKGKYNMYTLKVGWATMGLLIAFFSDQYALIQIIAYDPKFSTYSPMIILMELFVEEMYNKGIHTIDWGTYYDWKELWTNRLKTRHHLTLYSKRFNSRLAFLILKLYDAIKKTAKKNEYISKKYRMWRRSKFADQTIHQE